jgi:hypothetical protein
MKGYYHEDDGQLDPSEEPEAAVDRKPAQFPEPIIPSHTLVQSIGPFLDMLKR